MDLLTRGVVLAPQLLDDPVLVLVDELVELGIELLDLFDFLLQTILALTDFAVDEDFLLLQAADRLFKALQELVDFPHSWIRLFAAVGDANGGKALARQPNCTVFAIIEELGFALDIKLGRFGWMILAFELIGFVLGDGGAPTRIVELILPAPEGGE